MRYLGWLDFGFSGDCGCRLVTHGELGTILADMGGGDRVGVQNL